MTKKLYRFNENCGRMGTLHGHRVCDDEEISKINGKSIYFGEVLGKHSEIRCDIILGSQKQLEDWRSNINLCIIECSNSFIEEFERLFPHGTGIFPLNFYYEDDEESSDEEE